MNRKWFASRRHTQALFLVALLCAERVCALFIGIDLLPEFVAETGVLLVWGVGHCDTLDGPLAKLAEKALAERNVNFVLPWVRPEDEREVRQAFDHAQAVRELGAQARLLADQHFLETLVRIHRAGEGAAFTGLKPAGVDLGPAVPAADSALATGGVDAVIKLLVDAVSAGVRQRFLTAVQSQRFDVNDVAAGRRYVHAYVAYVHYVEGLWEAATRPAHGHAGTHDAHAHRGEPVGHH